MMRSSEIRRVRRFAAEGSGGGTFSQGGADGFSVSPEPNPITRVMPREGGHPVVPAQSVELMLRRLVERVN